MGIGIMLIVACLALLATQSGLCEKIQDLRGYKSSFACVQRALFNLF